MLISSNYLVNIKFNLCDNLLFIGRLPQISSSTPKFPRLLNLISSLSHNSLVFLLPAFNINVSEGISEFIWLLMIIWLLFRFKCFSDFSVIIFSQCSAFHNFSLFPLKHLLKYVNFCMSLILQILASVLLWSFSKFWDFQFLLLNANEVPLQHLYLLY